MERSLDSVTQVREIVPRYCIVRSSPGDKGELFGLEQGTSPQLQREHSHRPLRTFQIAHCLGLSSNTYLALLY